MAWKAWTAAAVASVSLLAASATAAPAPTPDEQLVGALKSSRRSLDQALRQLQRPAKAERVAGDLRSAAIAVAAAADVAARAVGALDTPSVNGALARAPVLLRQAGLDVSARRYCAAGTRTRAARAAVSAALRDFGVPLEREFRTFAVDRDFRDVRGFANYSGFTATAAEEVTEVVIGAATRATANAGEASAQNIASSKLLPITQISVYVIRDAIGRFTSNWCALAEGLITCRLRPTLRPEYSYTIAFGPKLERGTEVLVKFRTADGKRSYVVFTTR